MPDGVKIAVGLHMPHGFNPNDTGATQYPAIFEFSGYDGASAESGTLMKQYGPPGAPLTEDSSQLTDRWNEKYVIVHASVRGTGCSVGEFDLFLRCQ